jgi:5-methyltetrahydropteroyltriglutamate--homocysteine methyltransferase
MADMKLLTLLVGSYAQPDWLIDLPSSPDAFPPRVRALEHWRIPPEFLAA